MIKARKFAASLALVGALGMVASGCVFRTSAEPAVATSYYNPLYYQGYVVYYDTAGRPMYYANGVRYYVPATYSDYHLLTNHYRTHRVHYSRWYRSRGHRYRRYRRSRGRRGVRRGSRRGVRRSRRGGVRSRGKSRRGRSGGKKRRRR